MSANLGKRKGRTIVVQTRRGKDILNFQSAALSIPQKNEMEGLRQKYAGTILALRCPSSSLYNCHGMTFAARRTEIDDPGEVKRIMHEDDYDEIDADQVLPGDVMLYVAESGDIEHSGIVVEKPKKANLYVPIIYSKWGGFWEAIHWANNCPYDMSRARFVRITK